MIALALLLAAGQPSFPMEKMAAICETEFAFVEHDMRTDPAAESLWKGKAEWEAYQKRDAQRQSERLARRHYFGKSELSLGPEGLRLLDVLCERMMLAYLEGGRKQLEATPVRVNLDIK